VFGEYWGNFMAEAKCGHIVPNSLDVQLREVETYAGFKKRDVYVSAAERL